MIVYWLIYSYLGLLSIINVYFKDKHLHYFFFLFTIILLSIIAGLRGEFVAQDYWNYSDVFYQTPGINYWLTGQYNYSFADVWMEPLYVFMGAVIKCFFNEHIWMFLIVSIISVTVNSKQYLKYSNYVFVSLLLYFVHQYLGKEMMQIRFGLASAIGLFLIGSLTNKQYFKSIFIIMISSMFHASSLAYFFIYIIHFLKSKFTTKQVCLVLLIGVTIGLIGITKQLITFFPELGFITVKLQNYSQSSQYGSHAGVINVVNIKLMFFLTILLLFRKKLSQKNVYFETMLFFYIWAFFFRVSLSDFEILAGRVSSLFQITEVILLPLILHLFKQKFLILMGILFYAALTLYLNLSDGVINAYYMEEFIF